MPKSEIELLIEGCDRFLPYHKPRTLRERLLEIAESEHALKRPDQYGSGGFVSEFESEIAHLLGKESAVFMPSGTMAQQIALRIWADEAKNPRIAFHPTCHLQIHEQMAYRDLHHLEAVLVGEPDRLFTLEDLKQVDQSVSTLLIELPQREIGGQLPAWDALLSICDFGRASGMKLHLDGARLWECAPFYGKSYGEIAALFDSVYVSFYKILGGLPGAILAGTESLIKEAKVWQRRHGGNLQQQAANAISAKLGRDRHLPRMAEYVAKAREIASILQGFPQVKVIPENPPTNMMHLQFTGDVDRIMANSKRIAQEDRVFLFPILPPSGKTELTIGNAALEISESELGEIFEKLLS